MLKNKLFVLVLLLIFEGFFVGENFCFAESFEQKTVVINELMWSGTSKSTADEYIELRNLTDGKVDLSGWSLTRLNSDVYNTDRAGNRAKRVFFDRELRKRKFSN